MHADVLQTWGQLEAFHAGMQAEYRYQMKNHGVSFFFRDFVARIWNQGHS